MVFILFVVIFILYWWLRARRKAKLSPYMLECYLKITEPVPLCGKPDVVWKNGYGTLIVGDYKSRPNPQVYPSEVIQLSVYKLLVEKTQNKPVANYGFIHFKNGKRVRVKLMKEKELIALYHRYWDIMDNEARACTADNESYCQYCSHKCRC